MNNNRLPALNDDVALHVSVADAIPDLKTLVETKRVMELCISARWARLKANSALEAERAASTRFIRSVVALSGEAANFPQFTSWEAHSECSERPS
jgi:hypothetical protein